MAKLNLGLATTVESFSSGDYVYLSVGGSVRRIRTDLFIDALQTNQLSLRQYAWGVPIKQSVQTSSEWGRVGNLDMWEEYKEKLGRYLLTNDLKMAKLSPTDSSVYADGTALDETKGHVVVAGPTLYYLVKTDAVTGVPYLWMSSLPIGGHCIKNPIVGAYKGVVASGNLVSRSGFAPAGSQTITAFWALANNNGKENFGLTGYDHARWMQMLLLSEYGSPNSQSKIGNGVGGSVEKGLWNAASVLKTGATKSLGDRCGKIDITLSNVVDGVTNTGVDCSRVSLFGIEDLWGWQWEMMQGIFFGSSANTGQDGTEAFIYNGNRVPTVAELASHPTGTYRQITRSTENMYPKEMFLGEFFDTIGKTGGGGTDTGWDDYFYSSTTGQLFALGGAANSGAVAGAFYVHASSAFSFAYSIYGGRLACYAENIKYVNGKDIA